MNRKIFIGLNLAVVIALGYFVISADRQKHANLSTPAEVETVTLPGESEQLLKFVPADTLFFYGGLESMPYFSPLQGSLSQQDINSMIDAYHGKKAELAEDSTDQAITSSAVNLLFGLLMEYLKVEGNPELLTQTMGISGQNASAVYTIGATPVLRLKLADSAAFNAFMDKAEATAQITAMREVAGEIEFRSYETGLWPEHKLYFTIHNDYALFLIAKPAELQTNALRLLGNEAPAASLANAQQLKDIVETYQLDPRSLGYIDERSIINELTLPGGDLNPLLYAYASMTTLGQLLEGIVTMDFIRSEGVKPEEYQDQFLSVLRTPGCHTDLTAMANVFPRTVMGYKNLQMDNKTLRFQYMSQTEVKNNELLVDLQSLRGYVPSELRKLSDEVMLGLGLGVDATFVVPFFTKTLQHITTTTYTCEPLVDMQALVREYSGQIVMGAAALSGVVNGIKGLSVNLYDVQTRRNPQTNQVDVKHLDALVTLSADNPATLLMMASSMHPALAGVTLPEDGSVVDFPMPLPWPDLQPVKMAMKGNHMVFFIGDKAAAQVEKLATEPLEKTSLANFSLNSRKLISSVSMQIESEVKDRSANEKDRETLERIMAVLKQINVKINLEYDVSELGLKSGMLMHYQVK